MQPSESTSTSSDMDQPDSTVNRRSSKDYRHLIRKSRSMFKTNDLHAVPEDPDIINIQKLFEREEMKTTTLKYGKNLRDQDRITINISGLRFETLKSTLALYPNTLLGNEQRRKLFYDPIHNDYFFNRHRPCFDAILYFYQSHGRLRRPNFVPIDTFLEEITFFDLGDEALTQVREDENLEELRKIRLPRNHFRRYLWATLEYPEFSLLAKVVQILSVIVILISILALAVESLPKYSHLSDELCTSDNSGGTSTTIDQTNSTDQSSNARSSCENYFSSPFVIIQTACVIFFTVEFILRAICMPSLCSFLKNFMNWIDVIAILPFYIGLIIFFMNRGSQSHSPAQSALQLLRILRFARVFKFYRMFRNIKVIRVLAITLRESLMDFVILVVILTLLAFLFGAFIFYIENDINPAVFTSIFTATYWGLVTVTTVGYGDLTPVTVGGRIIACLCALSGIGTIAMLTSVIVDRYQRVYNRRMYIKPEQIQTEDIFNNELADLELKPRSQSRSSRIVNVDNVPKQQQQHVLQIDRDQCPTERNDDEESSDSPVIYTDDQDEDQVQFTVMSMDNDNSQISHDLPNTISADIKEKNLTGSNNEVNVIF